MAVVTANAWVTSQGRATITLWCPEGWSDPTWKLQGAMGDIPSSGYINLYSLWRQGGTGVIDGEFLKIVIETCPESSFQIQFEHGIKTFNLQEGKLTFGAALIGINNLIPPWSIEASSLNAASLDKALIYFGGDLVPFRGRVSAQLQVGGELHAIIGGNAVEHIDDYEDGYRQWAIPSVIFTDFFWHVKPSGPTLYNFVFREEKRAGGGQIRSFPVEMDLTQIYSPLSNAAYPVRSSNRAYISLSSSIEVRE